MGLQNVEATKFEKDKWFEKELDTETDWVEAYDKRYKYVGRYTYIFHRDSKLLEPFELALKWLLKFENYDLQLYSNDAIRENHMRMVEDKVDRILFMEKIPLRFVDSMRKATHPKKKFVEIHTMVDSNGICKRCEEVYIYCDCDPSIEHLEVKK